MSATLCEQNLGSMRWLTVSGEATDCFRALGGHMRAEIREAVTEWTSTSACASTCQLHRAVKKYQ